MSSKPAGTVTFLFTDVEGTTARWKKYPEAMKTVLPRHDAILSAARSQLDEEAFQAAFNEGKGMTIEQIVKFAGENVVAVQ
jgi:class 3 adenylate cyclase